MSGPSAHLLRSLLTPPRWQRPIGLRAGAIVDPSSGLLIDGFCDGPLPADLELLAALALDLMRAAPLMAEATGIPTVDEHPRRVLVETGRAGHLIVAGAVDDREEPVLVAVVVDGSWKVADRVGRRLAAMPALSLGNEQPGLGHTVRHRVPRHRLPEPVGAASGVDITARMPRPRPYADPMWTTLPAVQEPVPGPAPDRRA